MIGFILDLVLEILFHPSVPWPRGLLYLVLLLILALLAGSMAGIGAGVATFFGLGLVIWIGELVWHFRRSKAAEEAPGEERPPPAEPRARRASPEPHAASRLQTADRWHGTPPHSGAPPP